MSNKPSIPKGTRDFGPLEMMRRNYIFDIVRLVFKKYGYQPIETPAMENLETLTGKYGEEGDRLIFKIMPRGEKFQKKLKTIMGTNYIPEMGLETENIPFSHLNPAIIERMSEEALRYDLTVPFARYVVQHQNEINFPFKRYQIQPVWRADRPQRGRYREFFQCDVDVIGSDALLNEVELIQIIDEVFSKLGLEVVIKLNNRKVLEGICRHIGEPDKLIDVTVAIDKVDKIGLEKVGEELLSKGLSAASVVKLREFLLIEGSNQDKLNLMDGYLDNNIGKTGISELRYIVEVSRQLGIEKVEIDYSLARGLNYYTGAIFEVVTKDFPSSICGGGRYDDLTGIFELKDVSGVGVSFGADRIYDVLSDKELFPQSVERSLEVLFINFGENEALYCLGLLAQLRSNGISSELYPDEAKIKKQMKYANDRLVKYVAMVGSKEMEDGVITLKNMQTGIQQNLNIDQVIKQITQ